MSEEIIKTPLRNAAYAVSEHAQLLVTAVHRECLDAPVNFILPNKKVEVRPAYKPEEGWIVTVTLK